ncbi:MAG TPA: SMI1/KNR4 family protein [Ktedonobacterales bacterium]
MGLTALLDYIARDPDCVVFPPAGQPTVAHTLVVPEDAKAFYELCGGLIIGREAFWQARIIGPDEWTLAVDKIFGEDVAAMAREQQPEDRLWDWYIVAEIENANYLVIDCGSLHTGRCYDAHWETYGMPGQMPVVATSLTTLIERLYERKGQRWYWLESRFPTLGDAYDDE